MDGGWSPWYNMTDCSKSCGGGVITKWRNCTQPSPSCGGSDCQGANVTTVLCNSQCCQGTNKMHSTTCTVSTIVSKMIGHDHYM